MSEPLRRVPDARVIEWIDAQPVETLYLCAVTVAELRAGVALLPSGKRREGLHESLERRVLPLLAGRVLSFDVSCTQAYAALISNSRAAGVAVAAAAGYIAAIAQTNGFAVATPGHSAFRGSGRGCHQSLEVLTGAAHFRLIGPRVA